MVLFSNYTIFANSMRKRLTAIFIFAALLIAGGYLYFSGKGQQRVVPSKGNAEWDVQHHLDSAIEYIDHQRYEQAMVQLKEAEKLLPIIDDDSLGYRVCIYIGWINDQAGAYNTALDYEQMAKIYADSTRNTHCIVNALVHQVTTLNNMGHDDEGKRINNIAMRYFNEADADQQSAILRNRAYYQMLSDSLDNAEQLAYRAAMIAEDSTAMGNALSLLCRINMRLGQEEEAQMLMSMIPMTENLTLRYNRLQNQSELLERQGDLKGALMAQKMLLQMNDSLAKQRAELDIMRVQNQFDQQWHKRRTAERGYKMSILIIVLLLLIGALIYLYHRRSQGLHRQFQKRLDDVRSEMNQLLSTRNARISDLKAALDDSIKEIDSMKQRIPSSYGADEAYARIAQLKRGVDVINAMLEGKNISQFGKLEQQAAEEALLTINHQLAAGLATARQTLTPKETFFCIMEHYGRTDQEKAEAFCCTEQALRSTKSRLIKKINLAVLHSSGTQTTTT